MDNQKKTLLKLYIAGITPDNQKLLLELKKLLQEEYNGDYTVEVIDILETPELAEQDKILATPTVVRILPNPIKKFILNINQKDKLLVGMDLIKS